MTPIDDLFREGLGDRKPDVPQDLWAKIAAKKAALPEGEVLDHLFADKLAQRQAPVPANMWARIAAARKPAVWRSYAAILLLLLLGGLTYFLWPGTQVQANVPTPQAARPAGMPDSGTGSPAVAEAAVPSPATTGSPTANATDPRRNAYVATTAASGISSPVSGASLPPADRFTPDAAAAVASLPIPPPESNATPPTFTAPLSPPAPFRSSRRRFEAEVLLGAAYAHQDFGTSNEGARNLRDAREVSEYPAASFQLSLRLRYRLSERFRLLSGLTVLEIRNQFEYELPTSRLRQELLRTTNRLQLLEVPLLASYELPGRRLRLNVNAGPVINLATRVRGKYIHPNFAQPQSLEDADYRSNIGLGWTASLTTTYFIGKEHTTQLLLEPFFKHYPGSFTGSGAPLSEKYWVAGLQLGLRKQLR